MEQLFAIGTVILITIVVSFLFSIKIGGKTTGLKTEERSKHKVEEKVKIDKKVEEEQNRMIVKIEGKEYNATLEENETVKEMLSLFPMELEMKELNGNEKYFYLDNTLPTSPIGVRYIEAGDIMLYGNDCIVIFYDSFETSNKYTKIGHIDNLPNLGNKNVYVEFYE